MKLVIFDFDDTVVRLGIDWHAVKAEVLALVRREGIAVDDGQHLVPLGNRLSDDARLKAEIDRIYLKYELGCADRRAYTVFPEVLALVKELKARGMLLAIASGNHTDSIKTILAQLGLLDQFDFVCGRDSVPRNKPSPDQLELILRKLGAPRDEVLFVGDSVNDEDAAAAAGLTFFRFDKGPKKDVPGLRGKLGLP